MREKLLVCGHSWLDLVLQDAHIDVKLEWDLANSSNEIHTTATETSRITVCTYLLVGADQLLLAES